MAQIKKGYIQIKRSEVRRLDAYNRLSELVKSRNGELISKEYNGCHSAVVVRCIPCDYIWHPRPANLTNLKTWCPSCAGKLSKESRYEKLQEIARKKKGEVRSKRYIGIDDDMVFWCGIHDKEFEMRPGLIFKGSWCSKCGDLKSSEKRRHRLDDYVRIGTQHGWTYISGIYKNQRSLLYWECAKKHREELSLRAIRKDRQCSRCREGAFRENLQASWDKEYIRLKKLASSRHGKLLSTSYEGATVALHWQCACDNTWYALASTIERPSWCSRCSSGLLERLARTGFEQLLDTKFPKCSPDWLRTGVRSMQHLDGYNHKLKLAFEHQGEQHFRRLSGKFHKHEKDFPRQQKLDEQKRRRCQENGITLLEVPELLKLLKLEDFKSYVKTELERKDFPIPKNFESRQINWGKAYIPQRPQELKEIQRLAKINEGLCLSNEYLGSSIKLLFKCKHPNHPVFPLSPNKLKAGRWCRKCAIEGRAKIRT